MHDIVPIETQSIQNKIYTIRDTQVMLDEDLAFLYGVETKALNKSVNRNIERFPQKFRFQLILSHDRFLIIDDKEVYHFGASLKDLGKKWFAVSKMDIDSFELIGRLK